MLTRCVDDSIVISRAKDKQSVTTADTSYLSVHSHIHSSFTGINLIITIDVHIFD